MQPIVELHDNGVVVREFVNYPMHQLKKIKNPENTLFKGLAHIKQPHWVSVGTAIGLYRDGDFIPDDTDIDIGVLARKGQKHIEIPGMTLIRTTEKSGYPMQTAYIDPENECIFDIFYYYEDIIPDKLITFTQSGMIEKPHFDIKKFPTKYGELPFLNPPEEYFEDRYTDWKTPSNEKGRYSDREIPPLDM